MAMAALSTSALSSLEAMLQSLMRGGGGDGDDEVPGDDALASPPLPPLPARPTPRGRRPSPRRAEASGRWPPPPSSPPEEDDERAEEEAALVVELERQAAETEARLRRAEEENAALKRRIESYHIRWLEYEIKVKSMEEAFHEQVAALQMVQDAARRRAEEAAARGRRELSEPGARAPDDAPAARPRHGWDRDRDRAVPRRNSAVSRLSAEFRRQTQALEHGAAAIVAEQPAPGQQAAAASGASGAGAGAVDELRKLKAHFRAWKKEYKARLRKAKADIDRESRRRRASCWI
ncbi:hypothetical protein ACP4OV_009725 [Aristida adscensionis]